MGAPVVLPIPHVFESHVDPNAKQTIEQLWLGLNDPRSPFISRAKALEDCKIEKMEIHMFWLTSNIPDTTLPSGEYFILAAVEMKVGMVRAMVRFKSGFSNLPQPLRINPS